MRDWRGVLIFCLFLAAGFYWIVDMARNREPVAWVILVFLLVCFVLLVMFRGLGFILTVMSHSEQQPFREEWNDMRKVLTVQNAQITAITRRNQQLEQQIKQLPSSASGGQSALVLEDGIYDELED